MALAWVCAHGAAAYNANESLIGRSDGPYDQVAIIMQSAAGSGQRSEVMLGCFAADCDEAGTLGTARRQPMSCLTGDEFPRDIK